MPNGLPIPKPLLKRGGARNRADRTSWQLTERQCRTLLEASFTAWEAGMPFNRFITLAWGHGGIDAGDSVRTTGEFVRLAREWMDARGHAMPWAWVQECGDSFGQHAHLLLAVPAELEPLFRPMPLRWTKHLLPQGYMAGTLQTQRLQFAHAANSEAYRAELLGKLHYMLKCTPAALEEPMGMAGWGHKPWGQSCRVIGKRSGVWQNWRISRSHARATISRCVPTCQTGKIP